MKVNLPIIYSQFDPRWKNIILGYNEDLKYNINNYGCVVTSLSMVCTYYGHPETPASLNEKLKSIGAFTEKTGIYKWGSITKLYPDISETITQTPKALTNEQMGAIQSTINQGHPVMVQIDYNPKTIPVEQHYSLLVDENPQDENDLTMADTLGGKVHSLKSYLIWYKPKARDTIEQFIIYKGNLPNKTMEPVQPVNSPQPEVVVPPTPVVEPPQPTPPPEPVITPEVQPDITPDPVEKDTPISDKQTSDTIATFKEVIDYLGIEKTPENTTYDDCRRVIAGIKSTATDYLKRKNDVEKRLVLVEPRLETLSEEVSKVQEEMLRREKVHKAEIEALKTTLPNIDNLKKQWEAVYSELAGRYDQEFEKVRKLREENTMLRHEKKEEPVIDVAEKKYIPPPVFDKPLDKKSLLSSILNKVRTLLSTHDIGELK